MNTTTKVFIVLTMLMAVIFAGVQMTTYAYRENWKRRWHEDTTQQAQDIKLLSQQVANFSAAKVKSENLVSTLEGNLSEAQAMIKRHEATISERDKDIQDQQLSISKLQTEVQAEKERSATLSATLDKTRDRNNELTHISSVARAVAHQLNLKLAEVEDDFHNTTTSLDKARADISDLTKELNSTKAQVALVRDNHPAIYNEITDQAVSAKFVQGVVAAVNLNPNGKQDLVMLTIGKEASVEEGMEFIIFRASQYIVKVRAEKVLNDMVACRVIASTWNAAGAQIQVNDLAQNRL
jgi:predicted  nucleic acid-binding Zn-ribbon protein